MPHYNTTTTLDETIDFCRSVEPKHIIAIANHLQNRVRGFYPKSKPHKITPHLKKHVLDQLESKGFLVKYTPKDDCWVKVVALIHNQARLRGEKRPKGYRTAYQTNFLYLTRDESAPQIHGLPKPHKEMNLDLVAILSRFDKRRLTTWQLLNLFLCCADRKGKDQLRLHLYSTGLEEGNINLLEKVLDYGSDFKNINFPFTPNLENAKKLLNSLVSPQPHDQQPGASATTQIEEVMGP